MTNEEARVILAKYHFISFTTFIIVLLVTIYFIPQYFIKDQDIGMLIIIIGTFLSLGYAEAATLTAILFFKSSIDKKKIYIVNSAIITPVINLFYSLKMMKYNIKFGNFILGYLLLISGYSIYIIYYYFKNKNKIN